jgi:hypothetical protein
VLLKIYGMGHKIAELKEKIKLRKCVAYLQKGETLIYNYTPSPPKNNEIWIDYFKFMFVFL